MVKQNMIIASMALILLVVLGAMSYFGVFGSLNILGEEGYQAYDALLAGGTFDKTKWFYTGTTYDGAAFNCVASATSCNGGTNVCASQLTPYQGISASSNSITVSPLGYGRNSGYQGPYLRTMNLRLIDFKTEWSVAVTRCSSNKYIHGGGVLKTNRGVVYSYPEGSGTSPTGPVGIELIWDDYELGHYQIKANGILVQEGIVKEGEELYFQIEPDNAACNSECSGTATLSNPRMKRLFSCDPQEGEVKVHTCFAGPAVVQKADLKGFKSFCTALPATFSNAGVVTSSKQVYYSLAKDQPVVIQANQVWEFQYLADGAQAGFPVEGTAVVELCKQNTEIADLNDIPIQPASVSNSQLLWTSNGRYDDGSVGFRIKNLNLLSGKEVFMSTEPIKIDEVLCPYVEEWSEYRGISSSCVSIAAFGQDFSEGEEIQINQFLNVKLQSIVAQYRQDDEDKLYRWSGQWLLDFEKTAVQINQGSSSNELSIVNNLPGPVSVIVLAEHDIGSLDFNIIETQEIVLQTGQTKSFVVPLHTEYSGKNRLKLTPIVQTVGGGISMDSTSYEYDGVNSVTQTTTMEAPTTTTVIPVEVESSWFERLWSWLKGLFEVSS